MNNEYMYVYVLSFYYVISYVIIFLPMSFEEIVIYIYASIIIIIKIQEHTCTYIYIYWHSIAYDVITHVMICRVWITLMFLVFYYDVVRYLNLFCISNLFKYCAPCMQGLWQCGRKKVVLSAEYKN